MKTNQDKTRANKKNCIKIQRASIPPTKGILAQHDCRRRIVARQTETLGFGFVLSGVSGARVARRAAELGRHGKRRAIRALTLTTRRSLAGNA